jgi:hypothetical protein
LKNIWKLILNFIIFAIPSQEGYNKIKDGAVAQSVEQRTENPCVGGSIPPHTTLTEKALRGNS